MKTPTFHKTRFDCQRGLKLTDGRIIEIQDKQGNLTMRFNDEFLLDNITTTGNYLIENKQAVEVFPYEEYNIRLNRIINLSEKKINKILDEFKKNNFNVTREAIEHNYEAWLNDRTSGYRDEKNGYFLFSPCCCNPLEFSATTLVDFCSGWQETYIN